MRRLASLLNTQSADFIANRAHTRDLAAEFREQLFR